MTEELVSEIWHELKSIINPQDRVEAASIILDVMIDHDCDLERIRTAFAGDPEMKKSLSAHLDEVWDEADPDTDDSDDDN